MCFKRKEVHRENCDGYMILVYEHGKKLGYKIYKLGVLLIDDYTTDKTLEEVIGLCKNIIRSLSDLGVIAREEKVGC